MLGLIQRKRTCTRARARIRARTLRKAPVLAHGHPHARPHRQSRPQPRLRTTAHGFTLIEILVVLLVVAIGTATISLALRDSDGRALEHEAGRLVALLEGARAESRAAGMAVRWVPAAASAAAGVSATRPVAPSSADGSGPAQFEFTGLPATLRMPTRWLSEGTQAQVVGAPTLLLGPEAILPPQRLVITLGAGRMEVASDGLAPFAVVSPQPPASR